MMLCSRSCRVEISIPSNPDFSAAPYPEGYQSGGDGFIRITQHATPMHTRYIRARVCVRRLSSRTDVEDGATDARTDGRTHARPHINIEGL